ncbi:hypothetical protein AVEN_230963-1 [Araneus ventricosus]|uniref:Uncharacterized protein n=1 Tax=Araneus ventricosus TaxID=182803 RepID=A0A4Y2A3V6_ARAVE|nr:hypothetical protein AVEN_230963-1 [Araneus ventricosus]
MYRVQVGISVKWLSWHPVSKLLHHTSKRMFDLKARFNAYQAHHIADLWWNCVSNLEPSGPKVKTGAVWPGMALVPLNPTQPTSPKPYQGSTKIMNVRNGKMHIQINH